MDLDLSALTDPRDFPSRFAFARDVDRELRCAICAEFLDSAVTLPCCGVAFCSLCLRKALAAGEAECPNHVCRKPSCEASIRPLASMNRVVASWTAGRQELLKILRVEDAKASKVGQEPTSATANSTKELQREITKRRRVSLVGSGESTPRRDAKPATTVYNGPLSEIGNVVTEPPPAPPPPPYLVSSSSQSSAAPSIVSTRSIQSPSSASNASSSTDAILVKDFVDDAPKVGTSENDRCIVCSAKISPARMARHVEMHFVAEDREFRSKEKERQRRSGITGMEVAVVVKPKPDKKPLPKLNYHIMHLKEIKSRCDALKLGSVGKKEKLIQRHRSYTLLYNANLDSDNPKNEAQLRAEVDKNEGISQQPHATLFTHKGGSNGEDDNAVGQKINKKSKPEVIEKVMKEYEASHENQFSDLITKAKMTREGRKEKVEMKTSEREKDDAESKTEVRNLREEALEELEEPDGSSKGDSNVESSRRKDQSNFFNELLRGIRSGNYSHDTPHPPSRRSSSSSPLPAEQTSLRSSGAVANPGTGEAGEDEGVDANLSLMSQLGGAASRSLPSGSNVPRGVVDEDSRDGGVPRENEKDNYDDDACTPDAHENSSVTKSGAAAPSSQKMARTMNGKRSLSPSKSSSYFIASPSKRQRTLETNISRAPATHATTGIAKSGSSPDIDSQISYSVAKRVFGDNESAKVDEREKGGSVGSGSGSPILFPSNENSLDGTESETLTIQQTAMAPASTQPPELPKPPKRNRWDKKPDVNRNAEVPTCQIHSVVATLNDDIIYLDDGDTDDEDTAGNLKRLSKTVLQISKDSSFFHHPRAENTRSRNSDERATRGDATAPPFESTTYSDPPSVSAWSPPTSSVKSKPRSRKKVVPFNP